MSWKLCRDKCCIAALYQGLQHELSGVFYLPSALSDGSWSFSRQKRKLKWAFFQLYWWKVINPIETFAFNWYFWKISRDPWCTWFKSNIKSEKCVQKLQSLDYVIDFQNDWNLLIFQKNVSSSSLSVEMLDSQVKFSV